MTTVADVGRITANNLKKRFYVAWSYPVASQDEMMAHIEEHFAYMGGKEDRIVLSGPLIQPGATVGEGLTILRADTEAEATELMNNEPLIKRGLRRFELKLWQVQEGSLTLKISAVASTFELI